MSDPLFDLYDNEAPVVIATKSAANNRAKANHIEDDDVVTTEVNLFGRPIPYSLYVKDSCFWVQAVSRQWLCKNNNISHVNTMMHISVSVSIARVLFPVSFYLCFCF